SRDRGPGAVATAPPPTPARPSTSGNWKAGSWTITASTASGADVGNYAPISYATGTLTVNQKALTITANNQTQTYGAGNNLTQGVSFSALDSAPVADPTLTTNA